MKRFILTIIFLLLIPQIAGAENLYFSVSPAIIDAKALPRDYIEDTITVTNTGSAVLDIYTFVNNVDAEEGEKEFKARSEVVLGDSLANWIEISRSSIGLKGGESVEIPVKILANLNAKPGKYHAVISFSRGSTRAQAEERIDFGSSVLVNVEIIDDVKERLQIDTFATNKIFFGGSEIAFSYELQNTGNRDLEPKGEVRIYNRRGQEVGSVIANIDETVIEPDTIGQIAGVWSAGKGFGKYKALLDIEYGSSQLGTVNDTIYFWVIPWKQLLAIFLILAGIVGGGTYVWYQRYEKMTQLAYVPAKARKYRKFDEDSLLVPQHKHVNGEAKTLNDEHLLNLRT